MTTFSRLLPFVLLLAAPALAEIRFTDVSTAAGVDGDDYFSPTNHSLGVSWIDFDRDGYPDLFAVGGGPGYPPRLFHNRGNGTFSRAEHLLPTLPDVEMSGARFADYDRDGDPDLFIYTDNDDWRTLMDTNPPDGPPNLLLRNLWTESGGALPASGPLFEEVAAEAGLQDLASPPFGELPAYRSKTAAWLDYDRDGCIDLFVGHLVINDAGEAPNKDRFYRNRCDGTFEDVTAPSGVNPGTDPTTYRAALAAGGFHLDQDLWPDLYVANVSYSDPQPLVNDLIYRNQGPGIDGAVTFAEISDDLPGIGDDNQAGMGLDVADLDLDGDWDLYISDILPSLLDEEPRGNVLYLGDGVGGFGDNSAPEAGVVGHNSWGVNFFDADRDGDEDLFVSTIVNAELEILYRNEVPSGGGTASFTNVGFEAGFATGDSRGSAVADYDRDGDLDVAVVNQRGPLQLFRNDSTGAGHWIGLDLTGVASNTDAIGAIVEVTTGAVVRRRQVKGGSSAHSQDALTVHFGLGGADRIDVLRIRWPSGAESVFEDLAVDRYLGVEESGWFEDGFESGALDRWTVSP